MPRPTHRDAPKFKGCFCCWHVYGLRAPGDRRIRYVGVAHDLHSRWLNHLSEARQAERYGQSTDKDRWIQGLLRRGRAPKIEPLERVPHRSSYVRGRFTIHREAGLRRERVWIRRLIRQGEPLLNKTHAVTVDRSRRSTRARTEAA